MHLLVVGVNHKTTAVELREKLAFGLTDIRQSVKELVSRAGLYEAVILSTCNRTELYGSAISIHARERMVLFLAENRGLDLDTVRKHIYHFLDEDAVGHLFRVAVGLDSLVLGEPQILGQVRNAYELGRESCTTGARLSKLFPRHFWKCPQALLCSYHPKG